MACKREAREIINYPGTHGVCFTSKNSASSYPVHWHNDVELIIALKNGVKFQIKDTTYSPEKGDILVIWPRQLHELIQAPKDGTELIQFSILLVEKHLDLMSVSKFVREFNHLPCSDLPELTSDIADKIYQIKEELSSDNLFTETRCKILIYETLLMIAEYAMNEKKEQIGKAQFSDTTWHHIHNACLFIMEHSGENLTQAMVATHVGLSPYYFSRIFREYTHATFPAYLSRVRVQTAIRLLADKNLSITECAFTAGFQSTTAFNKVFHEITGHSPREYRKLLQ